MSAGSIPGNGGLRFRGNNSQPRGIIGVEDGKVAKKIKHVCLQTGTKHYLGPSSNMIGLQVNEPPFTEDMPRIHGISNFYTQEDILWEACKAANLTWSVHRANIIIGFAPRDYANMLGRLAVCAAICKKEGLNFVFPGDLNKWNSFTNLLDAGLIAEQELHESKCS
ncbi:3-oxo-Delta(4,5)-steroid 5-beta-reductase-like [Selaginella moellendorffii]|uniref:3-oxo-Delta(4,5)-steroid 5-beta-reductase-like n=1 Tax=Selaginella moellendorffii TaxID=88036 RepID=UPI000D1CBE8E|nr:3-oxo-Delta(4,5)-steroid 5-beta-reductase-like [Selaginella moellendorffii]|eukprot:XP_024524473.1 3-oxo-Delta(4,5)-steroid 5-beta-reductase-like [Selaginella moellendorffii]